MTSCFREKIPEKVGRRNRAFEAPQVIDAFNRKSLDRTSRRIADLLKARQVAGGTRLEMGGHHDRSNQWLRILISAQG